MPYFPKPDASFNDALSSTVISYVVDTYSSSPDPIAATDFLTGVDADGLALLRRTDHQLRRNGRPRFCCGFCKEPVHIRVASVAETGFTDGRRATFVHDPRTDERDCPFGSFGTGSSPAIIDGHRFQGRQEGARHRFLKAALCNMLRADPAIATADCEVLVTGLAPNGKPAWRRPDVSAITTDGRSLAFDVQLIAPLMHTIAGREQFYASQDIAWHWVVDPEQPYRLQRQGFQDMILAQGRRVLGFSETVHRLTKTDLQSRFYLLNVIEAVGHQAFDVSRKVIKLETVLRLGGLPEDGPPRYATDLRSLAFLAAMRDGNDVRAAHIFDLLAATCNASTWNEAEVDGLTDALTTLIVLLAVRDMERTTAIVRGFFGDDPSIGLPPAALRYWAVLIHKIFETDSHILKRARSILPNAPAQIEAVLSDPQHAKHSTQLWKKWSALLRRLFPRLAV